MNPVPIIPADRTDAIKLLQIRWLEKQTNSSPGAAPENSGKEKEDNSAKEQEEE